MMQNIVLLTMLIAVGAGLLGFILTLINKRLAWLVFLLNAGWQVFAAIRLFGMKAHSETISFPINALGLESLSLHIQLTELGRIFFLASVVITFLFAIFSFSYNDKKHATHIAPLWTILMGANAGIFLAGNWVMFLLSWELMGWTSYFIISHGKKKSAEAGLYYFILSLIGTSAMLAVIVMLYKLTGTLEISQTIKSLNTLWATRGGLVSLISILLLVTFLSKSAVLPFYMWPAKAHAEAPDDFSAFLSGVMIKYGVFGIIAFVLPLYGQAYQGPALAGHPLILVILGWIGAISAVIGTLYAIGQDDMKRLMAYSTVGNIGYITVALATNSYLGVAAAIFHSMNHMIFKGSIFLSLASVKFRTGERDMHKLGGIAYRMPLTFFTFLLGIIAAAGIPPMNGFGSKWLIFQSLFDKKFLILAIPLFVASTASFMYLFRGLHTIYLGQLSPRFNKIKEAPPLQSGVMSILMLLMMAIGFLPGLVFSHINVAIQSMGFKAITSDLSSIQGYSATINFTTAGLVFVGTMALVLVLWLIGKPRKRITDPLDRYTSGEIPEQWGLTPEKYHFGMNFYDYFEDMVNPILKKVDFDGFFQKIAYEIGRLGEWVKISFLKSGWGIMGLVFFNALVLLLGWIIL